jgi:NTE family protein
MSSTLGLALSGGAGRGLAHIGVLQVLERAGLQPALLAGTSMGGLVAAGYAAGRSPAELEAYAAKLGRIRQLVRLARFGLPRQGLLKLEGLTALLKDYLAPHETFETLHVPLAVVAVDLRKGTREVLRSGSLLPALRATMAMPGVFAPVRIGEQLLVDGGVLENLPVGLARDMGARVVLAVDVTLDPADEASWNRARLPTLSKHLWRSFAIMLAQQTQAGIRDHPPDLVIRPPIPAGITSVSGFRHRSQVIRAGEQAMAEALPRLLALLERTGSGSASASREQAA